MRTASKLTAILAPVLMITALVVQPVSAQLWSPCQGASSCIRFEMLAPSLKEADESFPTAAYRVGGRFRITARTYVVGELPIAHLRIADSDGTGTEIGNPYIGIERMLPRDWSIYGGVYLPLSDEDDSGALLVGALTDATRMDSYLPETTVGNAGIRFDYSGSSGVVAAARLGASAWKLSDVDELEVFADYGARIGRQWDRAFVTAGLAGRALLTEDGDLGERTLNQAEFEGGPRLGRAWTSLIVRVPLDDDLRDSVRYTVGFRVQVDLH
ncbi:MAG: hypothetical protein L0271_16220 [Gemmatimonadetes bacterium]|nr:hypothetical protein [Gemmatimonadota bacterium]